MPHCQKEDHDRGSKSKKERNRVRSEKAAAKKAAAEALAVAEEEAAQAARGGNNPSLPEGHGEYVLGCAPPREYKFNDRKRSKKHLRDDLRRREVEREEKAAREEKEEEELRRRMERMRAEGHDCPPEEEEEEEEEEEIVIEEYIVYICECCDKKFRTKNHFVNHTNSRRHRAFAAIFEDAGMTPIGVEIRGAEDEDAEDEGEVFDDDDDSANDEECATDAGRDGLGGQEQEEGDKEERDDMAPTEDSGSGSEPEEQDSERKPNLFSAFAAFDDDESSSSSSSSESSEDEEEDAEQEGRIDAKRPLGNDAADGGGESEGEGEDEEEEEADLLEEIIYQNKILQSRIDAEEDALVAVPSPAARAPLPFDDERYDPDDYDVNENRLAAVHHRLQKRLAERGIEPTRIESYASDAVTVGKTLLQQVMEANTDTLEARLEAYNSHKRECNLLTTEFAIAKGNSKALAGQYVRRQDAADNARTRANVHHAGSHYHMQAARSMQFGRTKGLMARHSSQGSRLQASRMAAQETARTQTGGVFGGKSGKVSSKKSNMKRRGAAGGSKKCGGEGGAET